MKKITKMNKIFLGGTCNNTTWRNEIEKCVKVNMFNPVVDDWTEEAQKEEENEKENKCNVHLYVITYKMTGVFSIAEVIDSVHNKNKKTIFHVIPKGFDEFQVKSLNAVAKLVKLRGGIANIDNQLDVTISILNNL